MLAELEPLSTSTLVAAPHRNEHPRPAMPGGNGQHAPSGSLPAAALQFLHEPSPDRGPSLKAQVLITLGQRDGQPQDELIKSLQHLVPAELATEGKNPKRGLLRTALIELESEGRISCTGERDDKVVRLVPPQPDPRFELDADLHTVLPPASAEEDAALERQLATYGCLDALILWRESQRSLLVDGYRRFPLCQRHGLPYQVIWLPFRDRAEVLNFLWEHHRGRRNLTPEAQWYAIGRLLNAARLVHGGDRRRGRSRSHSPELIRTAQGLAESFRIDRATLFRDGRFAEALDRIAEVCGPALRTAVLCRTVKLGRGNVGWLAAQDEVLIRQLAAALLAGDKVQLRPARQQEQLLLPLGSPTRQAKILLERLGDTGFDQICQAAAVLRRREQKRSSGQESVP